MANVVMTALQIQRLRVGLNGRLEGGQTLMITVRIAVASAVMAALGWIVWKALNDLVGTSLIGQLISVGFAISLAGFVYVRLVLALRIPEARQIEQMVMERLGRAR